MTRVPQADRHLRLRGTPRARRARPAPPDPPMAPLLAAARAELRAGTGGPPDLPRLRRQFETAPVATDARDPRQESEE